jgi:hypothetical protein
MGIKLGFSLTGEAQLLGIRETSAEENIMILKGMQQQGKLK